MTERARVVRFRLGAALEAAKDGHVVGLQVRSAVRRDEAQHNVRERRPQGGHGGLALPKQFTLDLVDALQKNKCADPTTFVRTTSIERVLLQRPIGFPLTTTADLGYFASLHVSTAFFVFGHRTSPPSTIAEGAADTRPINENSAERPKSETPIPQEPHTGYIRSRRQPSLTRDERQPKDIRGSSKDVAQQRCLQRKASVNTQPKEMQVPWSLSSVLVRKDSGGEKHWTHNTNRAERRRCKQEK